MSKQIGKVVQVIGPVVDVRFEAGKDLPNIYDALHITRDDGSILILNHFSGSPFWWLTERAVQPVADRVGFRSDFDYEKHILSYDWQVVSSRSVNLFGLSKLVVLRNTKPQGSPSA